MIEERRLASIVGAGNTCSDQPTLESYARDISFVNPVTPAYVVRPRSPEDVEKLVNLAREALVPLVPVSSGAPHFRGDTVPGTGDAIIVDLSGMKRIIRIDRPNRVVMFEPGVTFGELIPAVAKEGMRLNIPLLPRRTKSVVGSLLEREPVIMPKYHWDIADPLCDVEIIFGSGHFFRTGAAAGPGTIEEQWAVGGGQKEAAGPSSNSWYRIIQASQGTTGIVTWASARCELLPRLEKPFLSGSSSLEQLMEMVHWLQRLRLVNECFVLNRAGMAAIMADKWPADYEKIKSGLPEWLLFYNVAGYDYLPEERVQGQVEDIQDVAQRTGVYPETGIGAVSAYDLLTLTRGPCDEPCWKLRAKGACQEIFFITKFQNVTPLTEAMNTLACEAGYPVTDMGSYIQPVVQGVNFHCEYDLFYDPDDATETARVRDLYTKAVKTLMDRGAFFSRPYGEITDMVCNRDAATVTTMRKVKHILDPENIMNPGKLYF